MNLHKWSLSRLNNWKFWKGQLFCRLFGHRFNPEPTHFWCERCGLAYEEISDKNYWEKVIEFVNK